MDILPKVLFHDADGCLNAPDGQELAFSNGSLKSVELQKLTELGKAIDASSIEHLVINTGRSWSTTRFLCHAISSTKLRYALVEHGAELWDVKKGQQLDLTKLASESGVDGASDALKSTGEIPSLIQWFLDCGRYELAEQCEVSGTLNVEVDKSSNLTFRIPPSLNGDLVIKRLKKLIAAQTNFRSDRFVYHYSSWNHFVDVMGLMDKGIGLSLVMEDLKLDPTCAAAIGDGLNDLPMLLLAGRSLCPANAVAAVRQYCEENGYASSASYIDATFDWLASLDS